MKKLRLALAGLLAFTVLATPVAALAETGTAPVLQRLGQVLAESTEAAKSNADSQTSNEDNFKKLLETESKKQTLAQRQQQRLAELKTKPTAAETARLKLKCVGGQAKVKALEARVDNGITARSEAYNNLVDRLGKLTDKLKAAGVDTTKLETETTELQTKITTFQTDLAKYKIALTDLQGLGCQADPTGFKAALEAARSARATVAADAVAIRAYVKDPIKVTLAEIKSSFAEDSETSTDNKQGGN